MKESFIFHFEYLEDIPEDLQPQYAMYVINYARYGEEPVLEDWRDIRMWNKTKTRMDDEAKRYDQKCRNLRNARTRDSAEILEEMELQEQKKDLPEYTNGDQEVKKKAPRFTPPTPEEVQAYCDERKNGIKGQAFCDFYESKDWKVGNVKMKNWKAAVRTWEQRRHSESNNRWNERTLPADRNIL